MAQDRERSQVASGSDPPAEYLAWLADCVRNQGLVTLPPGVSQQEFRNWVKKFPRSLRPVSGAPVRQATAARDAMAWVEKLRLTADRVDYEPRTIAVSSSGRSVAIGTKAGAVKVWVRGSDDDWSAEHVVKLDPPISYDTTRSEDHERRRAVRVVGFVDDHTLVIGGGWHTNVRQDSRLHVYRRTASLPGSPDPWQPVIVGRRNIPEPASPASRERGPRHMVARDQRLRQSPEILEHFPRSWFERFSCWIPLWPPRTEFPGKHSGAPQVLGLALGVGSSVHVLSAHTDEEGLQFRVTEGTVRDFIDGGGDRLVGGCCWRDTFWLLYASGELAEVSRCEWIDDRPKVTVSTWHTVPLPAGSPCRGLRACYDGLAVRAGHHYTLLATHQPTAAGERAAPMVARPYWHELPPATDFQVFRAFVAHDHAPPDEREPVWMLVSSEEPGLQWIPWRREGDRLVPIVHRAMPSTAGVGRTEVLVFAHGAVDPPVEPAGKTACFLALGMRDSSVQICSFIHYSEAREILHRELRRFAPNHMERPGVLLWRAKRTLIHSLGLVEALTQFPANTLRAAIRDRPAVDLSRIVGSWDDDQSLLHDEGTLDQSVVPAWLARLERPDVEKLALQLCQSLRTVAGALDDESPDTWALAPQADPREATPAARINRVIEVVQAWVLKLLWRATQVAPDVPGGFKVRLATMFMRTIEGHCTRSLRDLRLLGEMLRKWVRFGHTYSTVEAPVFDLARWNLDGRRDLDALVYLVRLLRRRVDALYRSKLPTPDANPAVWALTPAPRGEFSLQSHHDGRVTAVDRKGTAIRWRERGPLPGTLMLTADGYALRCSDADDFARAYRSGPYTRAIGLVALASARIPGHRGEFPHFLVLLSFKGWRPYDVSAGMRGPLLACGVVAYVETENVLEVVTIRAVPSDVEIYTIEHIADRPGRPQTFLIGAQGGKVGPAGVAKEPWYLLALQLTVGARPVWTIGEPGWTGVGKLDSTAPRSFRIGAEGPVWQYNPATAMTAVAGRCWVGRDDGAVTAFRGGGAQWSESYKVIEHGARITALAARPEEPRDAGETRFLVAYGTAAGVIGVFDVTEPAGPASSPPKLFPLLMTRDRAPIASVHFFLRDGEHPALIAVSEEGGVSIYDVQGDQARTPGKRRRWLSGTRLDRFRLRTEARALTLVDSGTRKYAYQDLLDCRQIDAPELIVGAADGQVRRFALVAPKESAARGAIWKIALDLFSPSPKVVPHDECLSNRRGVAAAIGEPRVVQWLQILDSGEVELLRFALWVAIETRASGVTARLDLLEGVGQEVAAGAPTIDVEGAVDDLHDLVSEHNSAIVRLANDVIERQPATIEPVKILWDSASRLGNRIARIAVETRNPRNAGLLLQCYFDLNRTLEVLTNRWSGQDPKFEALVLIHSFQCLFDWPDVLLLARFVRGRADEPIVALEQVRVQLLRRLIQERLFHETRLVSLETLRVINLAIVRGLDHLFRGLADVEGSVEPVQNGFFELVTMVASLAERLGELSANDPLMFEIVRFFGLAMLLFPGNSLLFARYVSEWSLFSAGGRIVEQALWLIQQLEREFELFGSSTSTAARRVALERNVRLFSSYLEDKLSGHEGAAWSLRNSNAEILHEASRVRRARDILARPEAAGDVIVAVRRLLPASGEDGQLQHYGQSTVCLRNLAEIHPDVVASLDRSFREQGTKGDDRFNAVIRRAKKVLRESGVVSPQRESYEALIEGWANAYRELQTGAGRIIVLLDEFSRHAPWGHPDAMLDAVLRIVERLAPTGPPMSSPATTYRGRLREHLEQDPELRALVDSAYRSVDRAHLQCALLMAAVNYHRNNVGLGPTGTGVSETTPWQTISEMIVEACGRHELHIKEAVTRTEDLPGGTFMWAAILVQTIANVAEHGVARGDKKDPRLFVWRVPLPGSEATAQVLLLGGTATAGAANVSDDHFGRKLIRELCALVGVETYDIYIHLDEPEKLNRYLAEIVASKAEKGAAPLSAVKAEYGERGAAPLVSAFLWGRLS